MEISCSTLEINLVFPRTHVLFSIYYIIIIGDGGQHGKVHILFSHSSLGLLSDRLHQVLRLLVLFTSPRLFNKYKTFSVLIYSYNEWNWENEKLMETRRPKGGVFGILTNFRKF
jgi:hypothetical protein